MKNYFALLNIFVIAASICLITALTGFAQVPAKTPSPTPSQLFDFSYFPTATPSPTPAPTKPSDVFDFKFDFQNLNSADPDQAEVFFRRGSSCDAKKDYVCAADNYTKAIAANPRDAHFYFSRGKAFSILNKFPEAIADFTKIIEMDPKNDGAFKERGGVYFLIQKNEKAMNDYRMAAEIAPTAINYLVQAKMINIIIGNLLNDRAPLPAKLTDPQYVALFKTALNEAVAALNTALKMQPDASEPVNYVTYAERAVTYRLFGRLGQDMSAAAAADEKKSKEQNSILIKQLLPKTKAAAAYQEKTLALLEAVIELYKTKDFAGAIQLATKAIAADPRDHSAYDFRAGAYVELKQYDDAIADATKAIEIFPEFAPAYVTRGQAHEFGGGLDAAFADYDRAVGLEPNNRDALNHRGTIYLYRGYYDLAEIDLLRVIDLNPQNKDAHDSLTELEYLRSSGYNNGKVKDDALVRYVEKRNILFVGNERVNEKYDLYFKAAVEQPRDQVKICRLLNDANIKVLFVELFAEQLNKLVSAGRLDALPAYKNNALASIKTIAEYRPVINQEAVKQGCQLGR